MYNECRHIMPSGKKCHSPALRDKPFCYYHTNLHRLGDPSSPEAKQHLLPIEDTSGIQIALTQVLGALNSPHMDTRRAGLLLYGLQIATQLASRVAAPNPLKRCAASAKTMPKTSPPPLPSASVHRIASNASIGTAATSLKKPMKTKCQAKKMKEKNRSSTEMLPARTAYTCG
ncbi:MAG: hypothetical protein WA815_04530 [Terracidiphilus sp.]